MAFDLPCITYMALYVVSASVVTTNTRYATHWKLQQVEEDGVVMVRPAPVIDDDSVKVASEDPVLSILAQKYGFGEMIEKEGECTSCGDGDSNGSKESNPDPLHCGKHANKTDYDHLSGIAERWKHPDMPEPEVALIFKRSDSDHVDMKELETSLREAIKNNPNSLAVLNQAANYWRIRGNTLLAIECFRKAMSVAPTNPDVLLNLARVLINLQYFSDALFLTQKSLDYKSSDQNSWLQHFTLGEIYKALGNYAEATSHFRHSLDLNPTFHPAEAHLREMERPHTTNATLYTLGIIGILIISVCIGLYYMTDSSTENGSHSRRSTKLAVPWDRARFPIPPRLLKSKRGGSC